MALRATHERVAQRRRWLTLLRAFRDACNECRHLMRSPHCRCSTPDVSRSLIVHRYAAITRVHTHGCAGRRSEHSLHCYNAVLMRAPTSRWLIYLRR